MNEAQVVSVTLDIGQAAKLSRLAARLQVNEETLAGSLLSRALDDAEPDLDAIPGAFERAMLGRREATEGHTVALEDL